MELPDSDFDGFTTVMDIQDDMYESLRILWIAPQLFSWLKFEMLPLVNGLCAKNSDGEIVLKYNAWKEDYLGASFDEEIPKLSGSELLIREDYYNQIASHCGNMMPRFISTAFEIN